jgi:hypothetical protein
MGLLRNADLQRQIVGGSPSAYGTNFDEQRADVSAQVAVQADVIGVRTTRLWRGHWRICSYKYQRRAQIVLAPVRFYPACHETIV